MTSGGCTASGNWQRKLSDLNCWGLCQHTKQSYEHFITLGTLRTAPIIFTLNPTGSLYTETPWHKVQTGPEGRLASAVVDTPGRSYRRGQREDWLPQWSTRLG